MATAPTEGMLTALNARVITIEEAKLKTAPTTLWTATTHRVKEKLNVSQLVDLTKKALRYSIFTPGTTCTCRYSHYY